MDEQTAHFLKYVFVTVIGCIGLVTVIHLWRRK